MILFMSGLSISFQWNCDDICGSEFRIFLILPPPRVCSPQSPGVAKHSAGARRRSRACLSGATTRLHCRLRVSMPDMGPTPGLGLKEPASAPPSPSVQKGTGGATLRPGRGTTPAAPIGHYLVSLVRPASGPALLKGPAVARPRDQASHRPRGRPMDQSLGPCPSLALRATTS